MRNRWSDTEAKQFIERYGEKYGADLALRTYTTRLLGSEESLVLHGGGNTSVKGTFRNVVGQDVPALFMKASGFNLATIEPEGHTPLDLEYLRQLCALPELSDDAMAGEFITHRLDQTARAPSIETLSHAYLPAKFIDHTHADAILVLTNQPEWRQADSRSAGRRRGAGRLCEAGIPPDQERYRRLRCKPRMQGAGVAPARHHDLGRDGAAKPIPP